MQKTRIVLAACASKIVADNHLNNNKNDDDADNDNNSDGSEVRKSRFAGHVPVSVGAEDGVYGVVV